MRGLLALLQGIFRRMCGCGWGLNPEGLFLAHHTIAIEHPVPVRKPGKLPADVISTEYTLEYGSGSLEIHADAIRPGQRVVIVDDLLATGGTLAASKKLVEELGGVVVGCAVVINLAFLNGASRLGDTPVLSLVDYE